MSPMNEPMFCAPGPLDPVVSKPGTGAHSCCVHDVILAPWRTRMHAISTTAPTRTKDVQQGQRCVP